MGGRAQAPQVGLVPRPVVGSTPYRSTRRLGSQRSFSAAPLTPPNPHPHPRGAHTHAFPPDHQPRSAALHRHEHSQGESCRSAACVVLGAGQGPRQGLSSGPRMPCSETRREGTRVGGKVAAWHPVSSAVSELWCFRHKESLHLPFQTVLSMEQTDGSANSLILSLWRGLIL